MTSSLNQKLLGHYFTWDAMGRECSMYGKDKFMHFYTKFIRVEKIWDT